MRAPGYGETQPRLDDDRLPIVLVVLDGLGDRPIPELGGATPAEAARTPHLDALARAGASGWHLPFGWGAAPASELAHWAMFGFGEIAFPGRAVLEGLGAGLDVPLDTAVTHAALRTSARDGGRLWITGRAAPADEADAAALLAGLGPVLAPLALTPLGARGEALLLAPGHGNADVTDSDPFFETFHPWLRPVPTSPAGAPFAATLGQALHAARGYLRQSPVNAGRSPALDVLTTKWSGVRASIPTFTQQVGVAGAMVTSTRLYRGIARALGMPFTHLPPPADSTADLGADLAARLAAADELVAAGARFVHVHTKATDEAGHTKAPFAKRDVLEQLDGGLGGLAALARHAVVAVTGDHATPSTHGLLHAGEPTPLVVAGPTVRPDDVTEFGERPARAGWFGAVRAAELLALLLGHANRPVFLGHRITPRPVIALADDPEPMPPDGDDRHCAEW